MRTPTALLPALSTRGVPAPRPRKRLARRGDPRLVAGIALLALVNLALLPIVVFACLGGGIAVPGVTGCWPALASGAARVVEAGLAVVLLGALTWHTVTAVRHARDTAPRGLVQAACRRAPLPGGGCAWVLPAAEPLAYVAGLLRPRVVVSDGLLQLLSPDEQQAVLAHEAAHLRLGHARLLVVGSALARTYRWMPGVSPAWALLRRELEAAADDAAARAVGARTLLSALARVAIARARPAVAGFNDLDAPALRYRIHRLQHPAPPEARRSAVPVYGLTLALALAWSGCALAGVGQTAANLITCALAAGWLAARPAGGLRALRRRLRHDATAPTS
ncbi:M56 family metallopeptidase [Sporichthya polymorpha]|uniref:M56 family metallopeptidase n=1 Tax=Sporichthya polymorpha TaxID=35751 RepID=UPI000364195A|nr:M56 family metallopeptidase [Sporichthya polymorpha]